MARYLITPAVDEDLRLSAEWISLDNPGAAKRFLDAVFEAFDLLARFPEAGPKSRLQHERLKDVRFWVLPPPFNHWLVFYRIEGETVVIVRVLYGAQDWRQRAEDLF